MRAFYFPLNNRSLIRVGAMTEESGARLVLDLLRMIEEGIRKEDGRVEAIFFVYLSQRSPDIEKALDVSHARGVFKVGSHVASSEFSLAEGMEHLEKLFGYQESVYTIHPVPEGYLSDKELKRMMEYANVPGKKGMIFKIAPLSPSSVS